MLSDLLNTTLNFNTGFSNFKTQNTNYEKGRTQTAKKTTRHRNTINVSGYNYDHDNYSGTSYYYYHSDSHSDSNNHSDYDYADSQEYHHDGHMDTGEDASSYYTVHADYGHANYNDYGYNHTNTPKHQNSGGHANTGSSGYKDGSYTYHYDYDYSDHYNYYYHTDTGFDHNNYVPSVPAFFNVAASQTLRGTVRIGLHSYDQDGVVGAIKYRLRIRPAGGSWTTLLNNVTTDNFSLNTASYADGSYQLEARAMNDPRTERTVTTTYESAVRTINVTFRQNVDSTVSVANAGEVINFTFGDKGRLNPAQTAFQEYSAGLYASNPAGRNDGILLRINMKDADTHQYIKGTVELLTSGGSVLRTKNVTWSNGSAIIKANNANQSGWIFIPKSELSGQQAVKFRVRIYEYENAAATLLISSSTVINTISNTNTAPLNLNLDFQVPNLTVNATSGTSVWVKRANANYTASDAMSAVHQVHYQWVLEGQSASSSGWTLGSASMSLTSPAGLASGNYRLHVRASDKSRNEVIKLSPIVKIDNTLPVINSITPNTVTSYKQSHSVSVATSDNNGIFASRQYQWTQSSTFPTAGTWTNFTSGITTPVNVDGDWYLHIKIVDQAGNEAKRTSGVFKLDNTAARPTLTPNGNSTYEQGQSTKITTSDNLSGVKLREYVWTTSLAIPSSGWTVFSEGQTISDHPTATDEYYLHVRLTDNAGNVLMHRSNIFAVDNSPPTPIRSIDIATTYLKSHSIKLNTSDVTTDKDGDTKSRSGTVLRKYKWSSPDADNKAFTDSWKTFTEGQTITTPAGKTGEFTLHMELTDKAGNVQEYTSGPYRVDNDIPTAVAVPNTATTHEKSHSTVVTTADIYESKIRSAVALRQYQWTQSTVTPTGGTWATFAEGATIQTPSGKHGDWYLHLRITDNAGNVRNKRTEVFKIDNEDSVVTFNPNGHTTYEKGHTTKVTVSDALSGVDRVQYAWTDNTTTPTTWPLEFSSAEIDPEGNSIKDITTPEHHTGNRHLHVRVTDKAGNVTDKVTQVFKVDNTRPSMTITGNPTELTPPHGAKLRVSSTDANSGVRRIRLASIVYNGSIVAEGRDGVDYSWKVISDNKSVTANSGVFDYSLVFNGEYHFEVEDKAGNITTTADDPNLIVEVTKMNFETVVHNVIVSNTNKTATYNGETTYIIGRPDFYAAISAHIEDKNVLDQLYSNVIVTNVATGQKYYDWGYKTGDEVLNAEANGENVLLKAANRVGKVIGGVEDPEHEDVTHNTWLVNTSEAKNWPDGVYKVDFKIFDYIPGFGQLSDGDSGFTYFTILRDKPPVPVIKVNNKKATIEFEEHPVLKNIVGTGLVKKEYAIGSVGGINYAPYTGEIDLSGETEVVTIYAKYTDINGNYSVSMFNYIPEGTSNVSEEVTPGTENTATKEETRTSIMTFINIRKKTEDGVDEDLFKFLD